MSKDETAAPAARPTDVEGKAVWRMAYYRFKPGQEEAFWKDFDENGKPLFELSIQEGIMLEYKVFRNPVKEHAGDWDVMLALVYANYAALDTLEAQAGTLYIRVQGSPEAVAAAAAKRADLREVLAIRLLREVSVG